MVKQCAFGLVIIWAKKVAPYRTSLHPDLSLVSSA